MKLKSGTSRCQTRSSDVAKRATRKHVHEEVFHDTPEGVFELLHRPSAIRGWWGAVGAIVLAREGGAWIAN